MKKLSSINAFYDDYEAAQVVLKYEKEEIERKERAEYERLKVKYDR